MYIFHREPNSGVKQHLTYTLLLLYITKNTQPVNSCDTRRANLLSFLVAFVELEPLQF